MMPTAEGREPYRRPAGSFLRAPGRQGAVFEGILQCGEVAQWNTGYY